MKKLKLTALFLMLCMALSAVSCGLAQSPAPADGTGRDVETHSPETGTDSTESAPPSETRISFAAAGDNLIHESVYNTARINATALASSGGLTVEYYFKEMYSEKLRSIISSADLAFVNQEGPIVPERPVSAYPNFNTPAEAGDTLIDIGFDIVNLANNHMLDMEGQCEGLRSTIEYWNSRDIMPVGAYENKDDYNTLRIMECKGKRIAVLSYTYGTNGNKLNPKSTELVVPYINDSTIIEQVSRAEKNADAVIVSMHWGDENKSTVNAEQKRLASLLSKYGADVVIGHHSHTLQPMEWVTNDLGEKTLVIYSLGNLISSQIEAFKLVGGVATFELVFSPEGALTVENALLTPTMTHYSSDANKLDSLGLATRYGVSVGLLEDYTSDMCENHGTQISALNGPFTLATLRGYVTNTIPAEFLPDFLK